jgi:hypothetical protein
MKSSPRISYTLRRDATSEAEVNALAAVDEYLLKSRDKKMGTRSGAPERSPNGRAKSILHQDP